MALDKQGILDALKLKTKTVTLDNGEAIITEISATEYMEVFNSDAAKDEQGEFDGTKFTALLATRCIVDADGNRIFSDAEAGLLSSGASATFLKLSSAVKDLNGIGVTEKN
jgi:hypothetical protein